MITSLTFDMLSVRGTFIILTKFISKTRKNFFPLVAVAYWSIADYFQSMTRIDLIDTYLTSLPTVKTRIGFLPPNFIYHLAKVCFQGVIIITRSGLVKFRRHFKKTVKWLHEDYHSQ
jgi:hypothetical protein